ncbi:hypothetical protein BS78_01G327600 [Paspalum vaginatum]|nr:hypothetical protein BS78_01G327600 [Paspalum vaginatum]
MSPHPEWLPEGFYLEMRLFGNNSRADCSWYSCSTVVDSDTTNFKDFFDDTLHTYPCVPTEVVKLYYFCDESNSHVQVCTDQDLVAMFATHDATKTIRLSIGYFDVNGYADCVPSAITVVQTSSQPTEPSQDEPANTYLINPHPEYEHVGVDDEGIYSDDDVDISEKAKLGKDHEEEYIPSSDSYEEDSEYDFSNDEDHQDPVPPHEPVQVHNDNDPPMTVGSIYANMNVFRLALAQHSIKHEFEYDIETSEGEPPYS